MLSLYNEHSRDTPNHHGYGFSTFTTSSSRKRGSNAVHMSLACTLNELKNSQANLTMDSF
jgi:hypothetical protein